MTCANCIATHQQLADAARSPTRSLIAERKAGVSRG